MISNPAGRLAGLRSCLRSCSNPAGRYNDTPSFNCLLKRWLLAIFVVVTKTLSHVPFNFY